MGEVCFVSENCIPSLEKIEGNKPGTRNSWTTRAAASSLGGGGDCSQIWGGLGASREPRVGSNGEPETWQWQHCRDRRGKWLRQTQPNHQALHLSAIYAEHICIQYRCNGKPASGSVTPRPSGGNSSFTSENQTHISEAYRTERALFFSLASPSACARL